MIRKTLWMSYYTGLVLFRKQRKWRKDVVAWRRFWSDYDRYCRLSAHGERPRLRYLYPCLGDATPETDIEPIYFYQDAWAFEKIAQQRPITHVDVGSHHKFV